MTAILKLKSSLVIVAIISSFWASASDPEAQETAPPTAEELSSKLLTIQGNSLIAYSFLPSPKIVRKFNVLATAYSSTVWETDEDPHTTAAGTKTRDGIIANNMLTFGTKIRIPELYGDKIFVVEDRMNRRKSDYHIDIWFPSNQEAKNFGARITYIEILGS